VEIGTLSGGEIKALRERLGWSKQRLADEVGVRWITVNRWEHGVTAPSRLALLRLNLLAETMGGT